MTQHVCLDRAMVDRLRRDLCPQRFPSRTFRYQSVARLLIDRSTRWQVVLWRGDDKQLLKQITWATMI